jgi:hypothetical protein
MWTRLSCIGRWIEFCASRGTRAVIVYPILKTVIDYEKRASTDRTSPIYLGRAVDNSKTARQVLVYHKR